MSAASPFACADQLLVLLEQVARLGASIVGLLDGFPDAVTPFVDRLLDRAEGEPLEDEERDPEADERPDHQPRDDIDQAARGLFRGFLGEWQEREQHLR